MKCFGCSDFFRAADLTQDLFARTVKRRDIMGTEVNVPETSGGYNP